jgi:hypothetical protein
MEATAAGKDFRLTLQFIGSYNTPNYFKGVLGDQ